jgi:hypothetical protein
MKVPESNPIGAVRYLPALGVFLFLIHLGWVLADPDKPLGDPGTGWHIKLGELLVLDGRLGQTDPVSYTLPGRTWIDYQWLSHALMGVLHHVGSLPLVTAGWSVLFGLIPVLLVRRMVSEGVPVLVAWFLAFGGYLILSMHAQVRPHVWTYVLLVVQMGLLVRGGRRRWLLPVIFLFWANLHAGFTAGLLILACYALGECLSLMWKKKAIPWGELRSWMLLGMCCGLATLVNPWGFHLHRHIVDLMGMEMVAYYDEYQPAWKHRSANMVLFALLALGWMATVLARPRGVRVGEVLAGAVVLVSAVGAARHVSLFVIAALPVVGVGLKSLAGRLRSGQQGSLKWPPEGQLTFFSTWGYVFLFAVVFGLLSWKAPLLFRQDLRGLQISVEALGLIGQIPVHHRIFHSENMGGVLAYTFGPERKIFIDDRLDYYGDAFYFETYFPLMAGSENWRDLLSVHGVDAAVIPREAGLARVLAGSPEWRMIWSDEAHVIYRRVQP